MHFPLVLAIVVSLLASSAAAATASTLKIEVGPGGQLVYTPNTRTAAIGDILEFRFNPKNHSVVQSSFAQPCVPLAGGFFSGFVPVNSGEGPSVFRVLVNDTKPIWYYCAQTLKGHCQSGMVGAINAPATGNTFALFQSNAEKTNVSVSPAEIAGGVFSANPNFTSTFTTSTSAGTGTVAGPSQTVTLSAASSSASTTASAASPTPTKSEGMVTRFQLAQVVGLIGCVGVVFFL